MKPFIDTSYPREQICPRCASVLEPDERNATGLCADCIAKERALWTVQGEPFSIVEPDL